MVRVRAPTDIIQPRPSLVLFDIQIHKSNMSLLYPFPLPTTGSISFSECISTIEYRQLLLTADEKRARVRDSLKRAKRTDNPDLFGVVNALEEYIPYLFTTIECLDMGELQLSSTLPSFSWRLPMKSATQSRHLHVVEPPREEVASLDFEKGMILFTYALALASFAENVQKQTSENAEKWKLITNRLMKSESVLRYIAEQGIGLTPGCSGILDLHPSTISALITLISGSLHLTIIYKAQAQASQSSSLLSRVALYAAEKFGTSTQLFSGSINSGSGSKKKILGNFLPNNALTAWLKEARSFSIAFAELYMAISSQDKAQVGLAVAFTQHAKETLSSVESTRYLQPMVDTLKSEIEEKLVLFKAENDRIAFQKVPGKDEVEQNWPSGREVVSVQPAWQPPSNLLQGHSNSHGYAEPSTEKRGYY